MKTLITTIITTALFITSSSTTAHINLSPPITSTTPTQRPLTMMEMFSELDDIATIMNDEFKQRREGSLKREKDCHHRGVALRVDEGGIREQANSTRTSLVHVNVETREILQQQNELSTQANVLTTKIATVGNELRDTENDIVDAERLSDGNVHTYQSHKEKHDKNVAIVDELISYLKKETPGGDVLSNEVVTTPSLRPPAPPAPPTASLLLAVAEPDPDTAGIQQETADDKEAVHSPFKLTSLLNEIKQSMVDFAPQRDMSHEQLKSSHSQLITALDAKLERLETSLRELQQEKVDTSTNLQTALIRIRQVSSQSKELEHLLSEQKNHLVKIQNHITEHEKTCTMMEVKFNELRTLMMDDLVTVKEIKNMLGSDQLKRVKIVAESLENDLELPEESKIPDAF